MIQVSYLSVAKPSITESVVREIGAHAQVRNNELGITGILGFNGTHFVQVLEGEDDLVHQLVGMIMADERHEGFVLLEPKKIEERTYKDWNVRFFGASSFSEFRDAMRSLT